MSKLFRNGKEKGKDERHMAKAVRILKIDDGNTVLIPDHGPAISYDAPWPAVMAYALGYMKALINTV